MANSLDRSFLSQLALFHKDGGDQSIVSGLNTDSNDRVLILGGYLGDSVKRFLSFPHAEIVVVEPISQYYLKLKELFSESKQISIFNFGVSNSNRSDTLYINGQTTSAYDPHGDAEKVSFLDISMLINKVGPIDVLEINIEGAEYEVLERLFETNHLSGIRTLVIQFHRNAVNHETRRASIRALLRETHKEVFSYEYVWERWDRIN